MSVSDNFYDLFKLSQEQPHRTLASVTPLDPERASRYARKALLSECENVAAAPEGRRNHTLNRAAFSIGQLVAAGHVGEGDARAALTDAARSAGLGDTEIENTLRSGFGAGAQQPRVVADLPPVPDPSILDVHGHVGPDGEQVEGPPLNPVIDWHALFSADDEDEEWIVEPILPARRMVALYSAPKAGKSLLMLEIAACVARGAEVLGVVPDRPRRVLYIDFENDPKGDVRSRLEAMNVGPDDLDNLQYLSFPSLAKFDTAQGSVDLMRHVEAYQCEVVVIDTLSRSVMGDENENDTWLAFYRHTGLALKRAGVACIRLDHSGKDAAKGMRGGSAKSGDVDAVWKLEAINDDTVALECTDHRMPVGQKRLTLVRQEWPLKHTVPMNPLAAVADAKVREVDVTLDALLVPTTASVREARKALRESGHSFRNKAIEDAVKLRKLRVDLPLQMASENPSEGVPGTLGGHPGTVGEVSPGRGVPIGTPGDTSESVPGTPVPGSVPRVAQSTSSDPDLLVSCKSCFKPTTQAVAGTNGGLCAGCFRDTGQEPK